MGRHSGECGGLVIFWRGKRVRIEVTATRVTLRTVYYIAVDGTISGTVPQWLFLQDFQHVTERKKKTR